MADNTIKTGKGNLVSLGARVNLGGTIIGDDNIIEIGDSESHSNIYIQITGNGNTLRIASHRIIEQLSIIIGSNWKVHGSSIEMGEGFACGFECRFFLYDHGNKLIIGKDNLFSTGISIRCSDYPHLIFDLESGEYLAESGIVTTGDHVWVGEKVYLTKSAAVASNSIVGASSVVAKAFTEENVVLGGNPANVIKRGVHWVRHPRLLEKGSKYTDSYLSKTSRKTWVE